MFNNNKTKINFHEKLIKPEKIIKKFPISKKIISNIIKSREINKSILNGNDKRLLVIVGPCSIHDTSSTIEYAKKLSKLRSDYKNYLEIIMRTNFEKPRSIDGWKGLILDPNLDSSFNVNKGLKLARKILTKISELKLPTATEFLDILISRYLFDLISFGIIGARTVESQIHRQMTSFLPCPIGFKNNTDGNINTAINAVLSAKNKNVFISQNKNGKLNIYRTKGNKNCSIIMRGGKKPNYYSKNIKITCKKLKKYGLPEKIIIDFSHGNSKKKYKNQINTAKYIAKQIKKGSKSISGIMIESFLLGGKQKIVDRKKLNYGQSITDACLNWRDTENLIKILAESIKYRF